MLNAQIPGLTKIGEIATGEPLAIEEWDHDYVMIVKEHVKCEGKPLH